MKCRWLTLAVGCGLVVPASNLLLSGAPTLLCPMPFLTVAPAFVLASLPSPLPYWTAVVVPSLLFFVWSPGLFRCQTQIPRRSWVLLSVLTALTVVWFIVSWKFGLEYQGHQFTRVVCAVNALWLVLLWLVLYQRWRHPSFTGNLLFHWILFAWLAWYAFPYLGELP